MKNRLILRLLYGWLALFAAGACAQTNNCTDAAPAIYQGSTVLNYGSLINAYSPKHRTTTILGDVVTGTYFGANYNGASGFYSRFLLPPAAPTVSPSEGDLPDRIQVNWSPDPLSPVAEEGFNIYRDGAFLVHAEKGNQVYLDFNVQAGKIYTYEVAGINEYGEGGLGSGLGYVNPNGVVTGQVETINGSPVPNALVTLTPMQGFSAHFEAGDKAFATEDSMPGFIAAPGLHRWTIALWIQIDDAINDAEILQFEGNNWVLRAYNAGLQQGVRFTDGFNDAVMPFPAATKQGWHHLAITYDEKEYRLYLDGALANIVTSTTPNVASTKLRLGQFGNGATWNGRLDELRIYHRLLDELDLAEVMQGTASSSTPGLAYYWKMDEEKGTKAFDIIGRHPLYFCDASFDSNRPPVHTSALTNQDGYYKIEGVNYGSGTTFLAKPSKDFYLHRALKFERDSHAYAVLPKFGLTDTTTLELWVNTAGPYFNQPLLFKTGNVINFRLSLAPNGTDNNVVLGINNSQRTFGLLGMGYHHLTFRMVRAANNSLSVTAYRDSVQLGIPTSFGGVSAAAWADTTEAWIIGSDVSTGQPSAKYFVGLMDEVAFYDTLLPLSTIAQHVKHARDPQEKGLRVYFALDEGSGFRLNNTGKLLTNAGTRSATAKWSTFSAIQEKQPHEFLPATRQVTLNPSNTSVDQVDFTDRSTVAVSGFVRYVGTECFARNVEILVDGASYNPPIYTDSTGKFVIDLDPGASATLTPKYADHLFSPAFWELTNVNAPVAGILFTDMTKRKVQGTVAGGFCKKSIITNPGTPQGTICKVKVASKDGCFERTQVVDNEDGLYQFLGLPPLEMTVAVIEHSNPLIKTAFQVKGGATVDLTKRDSSGVDFLYFAPPQVKVAIDSLDCDNDGHNDLILLDQDNHATIIVTLEEVYAGGNCRVDSASFHIDNGFSDDGLDTTMSGGQLKYTFQVGLPNPTPPYLKTMQIIATTLDGNEVAYLIQAVVTGVRSKENTFTSITPELPSLILRDPPGDGSYTFLEKNQQFCKTTVITDAYEVGGGAGLEVHLGGSVKTVAAPLGIGFIIDSGPIFDIDAQAQVTYQKITSNSYETCTSVNSRVSTSDGDVVVGGAQGGDVYMGEAINLIFGFADMVTYNDTTCSPEVKVVLNVEPGEFATTFIYSEFHIRNNVMRYLDALIANPPDSLIADTARFIASRNRWQDILDKNQSRKDSALTERNISFDAGSAYEYAQTAEGTNTSLTEELTNSEESLESHFGFQFNAAGVVGMLKFVSSTSSNDADGNSNSLGTTVGYVLQDDDPGDAFTVDVGKDAVYQSPVFRIKAGQSSCPWEVGTANREGPKLSLAPGYGPVVLDVPSNEAAVYQFTLGNLSATNEDWTYGFSAIQASNPDGAIIRLNGAVLNSTQRFIVPYGTSIPVTLTIERGPVAYDYDSLLVALYSECEYERDNALSLSLDGDLNFFSPLYLGAHFIKPCSEVEINVPQQDWVIHPDPVTPGTDDVMNITVSEYDKANTDFEKIRVQYRRSDGDGAWINIGPDILRANLGNIFTQVSWNSAGLADGPYEIRAVSVCSGDVADKPGYSHVIKGRIEREPPSIVGTPQPSDGVLQVGDEISVTFNKHIDCSELLAADVFNDNNVGLYDATTGNLIDIDITCFENKITVDPNFQNEFFENHLLRLELHNIPDKIGNELVSAQWEFYVDRNELAWLTDSIGATKYDDESKVLTAKIHNRGGYPVPFSLHNVPSWVHVVPDTGVLVANEIQEIRFEIDSLLSAGLWTDSIVLHTVTGQNAFFMGGDEGLPIGVRVVCRPPQWQFNTAAYPVTMNFVLKLNIEGTISTDVEDRVAAYIDNQLRGSAKIQYVPLLNAYVAFLTVYGEASTDSLVDDTDKPVLLEIWDASECLRYGLVLEQFTFQPDNIIGSTTNPQVIHTSGEVLREIPLTPGWNWISFNLAFPNAAINPALATLQHPEDDYMKGQTKFSEYFSGVWYGSLDTLGNKTMYQYRAEVADTLKMIGDLIDPTSVSIPVVPGWNWISYLPNQPLTLGQALASVNPVTGDLLKGQHGFAQYVSTYGWVGNLTHMQPPQGYQLRLTNSGTLTYPDAGNVRSDHLAEARGGDIPAHWQVNAAQYEHSMTLIGMLAAGGENATLMTQELGAFVGDDLRGAAQAIYIEPLNAYLFFLTTYANQPGEQVHFKLYDGATGQVSDLQEMLWFAADLHQGSIESPIPFMLQSTGLADVNPSLYLQVQPNPFREQTTIQFSRPRSEEITLSITDAQGRLVLRQSVPALMGMNAFTWQAGKGSAAGVYFVRLETADGVAIRKVVKE